MNAPAKNGEKYPSFTDVLLRGFPSIGQTQMERVKCCAPDMTDPLNCQG